MPRKNPLIFFYARSCAIGFALAAIFTAAVIVMDVARIGHLVSHVDGGYLAAFLLWFFNGIVFSGAQAAVSVLLMAERDDDGGRGTPDSIPVTIPVRAQ